ncbi:hypothetical protein HDU92_007303 [Lobulomyces angularis]|nr:hypothetical protein HDU92_007303 [Lobulomyces angularis]
MPATSKNELIKLRLTILNNGLEKMIGRNEIGDFVEINNYIAKKIKVSSWLNSNVVEDIEDDENILVTTFPRDSELEEILKLNSTYEFTGYFHDNKFDEDLDHDMDLLNQLSFFKTLKNFHVDSIKEIKHFGIEEHIDSDTELTKEEIVDIRTTLLDSFSSILYGDEVAAQFILAHLFSSQIEMMDEKGFNMNFLNFDEEKTEIESAQYKLFKFLESVKPSASYLPLFLEYINQKIYSPTCDDGGSTFIKAETDNKEPTFGILKTGELQLPSGTQILVDETKLKPGKVNERGIRNLQALQNLINKGEVCYKIPYSEINVETNVPVIVVSVGKSMFQMDFVVPLLKIKETESPLDFELVVKARKMIHFFSRRWKDYNIPLEVRNKISEDFAMRKNERIDDDNIFSKNVTTQDLKKFLDLLRGTCLSFGKFEADFSMLELCSNLEKERIRRVIEVV